MIPIRNNLVLTDDALQAEIRLFAGKLNKYSRPQRRQIIKALKWSQNLHEGQKRDSSEPYIIHPIRTAEILIDLKLDPPTVISALLHDILEDTHVSRSTLVQEFGEEVSKLVDGVTKIDDIKLDKSSIKAASLRKMVWAMVDDLRVIIIKLADKRHNMNTLQYIDNDERRTRIASECLDIFAPMAGKLGMSSIKSELEDLSLKYLKPEYYNQIKERVALRKEERHTYLSQVKDELNREIAKSRLKVTVEGRAKHFYSIYRKMKDRNKELDEIYDFMGLRIICDSINTCYVILGIVHRLWTPFSGRFKDYIACPKSNGYQSLHTAVLTGSGRPLEIQIRTQSMHETAKYGIAAHWAYKEGKTPDQIRPSELAVVKQLQNLREEGHDNDADEFLEAIKQEILRDSIIVYTPKGDAIELPEGATAIDFAYHIHSEIGEHCIGAKADDHIIPLTRPLENTQTIQILTSVAAHPHVNWLRHVRSSRARSKIRSWLNHHDTDVVIDRNIVAQKKAKTVPHMPKPQTDQPEKKIIDETKVGISIENQRNMMIKISQCCSPSPGEPIIGYISRGRGIVVHHEKCPNLKGIEDFEERRIQVDWETASSRLTQRFKVHSRYTQDLFSEIESAIRKYHGHLISGSIDENERGDMEGFFTVEMQSDDDFHKITKSIRNVPSVMSIDKVHNLTNRY